MNILRNVAVIGLGPHAKRIYISLILEYNQNLRLVVDLESNKNEVEFFLSQKGIRCNNFYLPDDERDFRKLSSKTQEKLTLLFFQNNITHVILSSEPKAHYAYLSFLLDINMHILVDKPLTAINHVSTNSSIANQFEKDYFLIANKVKKSKSKLVMHCQRRWHKGYISIFNLINKVVTDYNVPITSINITHSDGMWNMPNEFFTRENHPYKYGYGKLLHSGFHFIDLLAWFMEINLLNTSKCPDRYSLYANCIRPSDFLEMISINDYYRIFKTRLYDNIETENLNMFGELDVQSLIQFKRKDKVICTANLTLLQNSFSRRSWQCLPKDTYKSNGRVRHEYVSISVGPLLNVQVHSYQSKEIKDEDILNNHEIGECQHFDIYIFRNIDIIGGKAFEKVSLETLEQESDNMGQNEKARKQCFLKFLNNEIGNDSLYKQYFGIALLSDIYKSIASENNPLVSRSLELVKTSVETEVRPMHTF